MNLEEFANAIINYETGYVKFYDRKNDKLVNVLSKSTAYYLKNMPTSDLSKKELTDYNRASRFLSDRKRYIYFDGVSDESLLLAAHIFYLECDEETRNKLGKYQNVNSFFKKVSSNGLEDKFNEVLSLAIVDDIVNWAISNEIDVLEPKNKFNNCFEWLKRIYKIEPWKYFCDLQLVKVRYEGVDAFFNILGNSSKLKGLAIYYNQEGYNDYEMLKGGVHLNPHSLLYMSLSRGIMCYYNSFDELHGEERVIIEKSKCKFDDVYPSITFQKEGFAPLNDSIIHEIYILSMSLRNFYLGMLEYINSPLLESASEDKELAISISKKSKVKLSECHMKPSNTINDYGFNYKINNKPIALDNDKQYEIKLNVLNHCIEIDDLPHFVYYLIVRDVDDDSVVFTTNHIYDEDGKAITKIVKDLHKYAKENGFARHVLVSDTFEEEIILEAIGDKVDIQPFETSKEMEDIMDTLSSILEYKQEELDESRVKN